MTTPTEFKVVIKGTRPLLMHNNVGVLEPKKTKIKSSEYDNDDQARKVLYFNDKGDISVPSMAILSAMRRAGVNQKKGGAGKKTLKDYVYSGLRINPFMIPITPQDYKVDVQVVVVNRSRIPRARPRFDEWQLTFNISIVDSDTWDAGNTRLILSEAGQYQGLLDFRPLYGLYEVVSFEPVVTT